MHFDVFRALVGIGLLPPLGPEKSFLQPASDRAQRDGMVLFARIKTTTPMTTPIHYTIMENHYTVDYTGPLHYNGNTTTPMTTPNDYTGVLAVQTKGESLK